MISSRDSLPEPRSSRTSSSSRSSLRPTRSPPLASTVGRGGTGNCCRGYSGGARRATSRPGFLRSPAGRCSTTCGARCPRPPPCSRWSPAGPSRAARPPCGPVSFWSRWPCRPSCPRSPSWFCRARASPRGLCPCRRARPGARRITARLSSRVPRAPGVADERRDRADARPPRGDAPDDARMGHCRPDQAGLRRQLGGAYRRMHGAIALAVAVGMLVALVAPERWPFAAPFILLWLLSPLGARWLSRPTPTYPVERLSPSEARILRSVARRTWRFFETLVGPADNHLPPDNLQEDPEPVVAHRTSPTNIGLYLLSTAAARDFGWIGTLET